jgi:hypothetical protein
MATTTDDRIAELERENEMLRAEVARLRPPPPPEPARLDGPFRMPTAQQMTRLVAAVLIWYPGLRDYRIGDTELLEMVTAGFRFVAGLPRTPGRVDHAPWSAELVLLRSRSSASNRPVLQHKGTAFAHRGNLRRGYWLFAAEIIPARWFWGLPDRHHERHALRDECLVANPGS